MTRALTQTVVLLDPEYPKMKDSNHPWHNPATITPEMETAAANLINYEESMKLIAEVEGPTDDEWNEWFYKGKKPLHISEEWFVF